MKTLPYIPWLGFDPTGDLAGITMYTSNRGNTVIYPKSPPLNPPSATQQAIRNRFRLAAMTWRALSIEARAAWQRAAYKANLRITGYNLFIFWHTKRDRSIIQTIERQTNEVLINAT